MNYRIPRDNSLAARLKGSALLLALGVLHLFHPQGVYREVAKAGHLMWQSIQYSDDPTPDGREGEGEFGGPPRPGESKKQFAERVLDEAQEAPSWDAYVYSLACGLYEAEKRTYPEPSMESGGTSSLRDPDEEKNDG